MPLSKNQMRIYDSRFTDKITPPPPPPKKDPKNPVNDIQILISDWTGIFTVSDNSKRGTRCYSY